MEQFIRIPGHIYHYKLRIYIIRPEKIDLGNSSRYMQITIFLHSKV